MVKLSEEEKSAIAEERQRGAGEHAATRIVLARRAFRVGIPDLEKLGAKCRVTYETVEASGGLYLQARIRSSDGAAAGKRAVEIKGDEQEARRQLDRQLAYDLAALMINGAD